MKTKHLPLIVGISLPVIFIVIISVVVLTPSLFIKPQHNFIYITDDNIYGYSQNYKSTYVVEGGQLSLKDLPVPSNPPYAYKGDAPTLYLYDVKADLSHQVDFGEAKNYNLDPGPSSPDGYMIKYNSNYNGIFDLFGSSNNNGYYIEKNRGKKELSGLTNSDRYYQNSFKLIGWIK